MLKRCFSLLLILTAVAGALAQNIVVNGIPDAVIVVPEKASSVEEYAAKELQYIVKRASGAELPIDYGTQSAKGKFRILLGRAAGISLGNLPPCSFKVKSSPETLLLVGQDSNGTIEKLQTAAGTVYAVYEWAERELGVRWLWPDQLGEEIPARKNIVAGKYDLNVIPKLRFATVRQLDWRWNRRLFRADTSRYIKFAGCPSQGHAFIDWYKRYGKTNPDFFEMDATGKRVNDRYAGMCVSNPAFHKQIVENWRATGHSELAVNAKENDAHGRCMCSQCRSWDGEDQRWPTVYYSNYPNVGERYARFYKAVWEMASKYNPDVLVGGYAYMNYVYAPRNVKLNRNIVVGFVDDLPFPRTTAYQKMVDSEIENWGKSGASLYLRPNFFHNSYAMPEIIYHQYAAQFKLAYHNGMLGLDVDGPNNSWATLGPNLYVMARLVVDPERPVDELMKEYCGAFGKAAPAVEKYFAYWEKYTMEHAEEFNRLHEQKSQRKWFFYGFQYATLAHLFFPESSFAPAGKFLLEAEKLAAGDRTAEQRVSFLQQGLEHARICSRTSALFADPASTNQQRLAAIDKVKSFRKQLMPKVADISFFESKNTLEAVAWVLHGLDLNNAIALPEQWRVQVDMKSTGRDAGYFRPDFDDKSWMLRSSWDFLENQGLRDYRHAWYRTTVEIPDSRKGERIILRLGAIDESGWCWVNGQPVGELLFNPALDSNSWNTPQEYDITKVVKFGQGNQITVLVENNSGNGGLWKPSFILFEKSVVGESVKPDFSVNRVYASQTVENGSTVWRMIGRPDRGTANAWQTMIAQLPHQNVGKECFRIKAKIKTKKLVGGEFLLVFRQMNATGQTITYDGIILKEDCDWKDFSKEINVRENAKSIAVYAIAKNLGKDAEVQFKDVIVEQLQNK